VPTPGDLAAAFRSLADAYNMMRQEGGSELLETLMERLYETAERPPREVKGVSDEFLAGEWNTYWAYEIRLALCRARTPTQISVVSCKIGTLTKILSQN
jgi:hypothetical protein